MRPRKGLGKQSELYTPLLCEYVGIEAESSARRRHPINSHSIIPPTSDIIRLIIHEILKFQSNAIIINITAKPEIIFFFFMPLAGRPSSKINKTIPIINRTTCPKVSNVIIFSFHNFDIKNSFSQSLSTFIFKNSEIYPEN